MGIRQKHGSGHSGHDGHVAILLTTGRPDAEICDAIVQMTNSFRSASPLALSFAQWRPLDSCHGGVAGVIKDEVIYAKIISYNSCHLVGSLL